MFIGQTMGTVQKQRTRRDEIYDFVVTFADDHSGASLTPHGIWMEMKRVHRDFHHMKWSTFRSHWANLLIENRLEMRDGVVVVVGAEWHPPDAEILPLSPRLTRQY
jgi:hypothetical protein